MQQEHDHREPSTGRPAARCGCSKSPPRQLPPPSWSGSLTSLVSFDPFLHHFSDHLLFPHLSQSLSNSSPSCLPCEASQLMLGRRSCSWWTQDPWNAPSKRNSEIPGEKKLLMAEWRIALFASTSSLATLRGLTSCMDKESLLIVIKDGDVYH